MLTAEHILEHPVASAVDDTLTLPFDVRQKSRFRTKLDSGRELFVQLPRGSHVHDGTLLKTSEGLVIRVRAAAETLSVVETADPLLLARAAYHLGNRHVPLQVELGRLSYLHDHVLDDMLHQLGLHVIVREGPFQPEHGAYGGGHATGGGQGHGGHGHGHGEHGHGHDGHDHGDHGHHGHGHRHDH
jgi:urease accessory protein